MARYGNLAAWFYANDGLGDPVLEDSASNSELYPIRARWMGGINEAGWTEAYFPMQPYWDELLVQGNICVLFQDDAVWADAGYVAGLNFGTPFIIKEVQPISTETGAEIRIAGPDLTEELKYGTPHFRVIAEETTVSTTLAAAVAAPVSTTVLTGQGAPAGVDNIALTSDSGVEIGMEIRVTMSGGRGTFIDKVVNLVYVTGQPRAVMSSRLPFDANPGEAVVFRHRHVRVTDNYQAFTEGTQLELEMNSGTLWTLIAEPPYLDDDGYQWIVLKRGVSAACSAGNDAIAHNYVTATDEDVDIIMAGHTDPGKAGKQWSIDYDSGGYTGTADGTYHFPVGESTYDLLQATAEKTGESFRQKINLAGGTADRVLVWMRVAPTAGHSGIVQLVMPSQGDAAAAAVNINRAIIRGQVKPTTVGDPATRVYPFAGDNRIKLTYANTTGVAYATAAGYSVNIVSTGLLSENEPYEYPYINDATLEADSEIGVRARTETFSDIRASGKGKVDELRAGANELIRRSVAYLQERGPARKFFDVDRVIASVLIQPGDLVSLAYTDPSGEWSLSEVALYVQEVTKEYDIDAGDLSGISHYTLRLSEYAYARPSIERTRAELDRTVQRMARFQGGQSEYSEINIGALTTQNITYVNSGATESDIAAAIAVHAAIDDAHHDPVTAADTSIDVSTQAISVNLATNPGLEVSSGLKIDLQTNSGLILEASGLRVKKVDPNAITVDDAGGVYMLTPGTVSASSSNSAGYNHTHAVTASSDVSAGTASLLKSDANGAAAVRHLGAGVAASTTKAAFVQAASTTHDGLVVKQLASQTGDIFRVEDSSGGALLIIQPDGALESGAVGFVSGLTGWQLTPEGRFECQDAWIRGAFHASIFVADETHATGGTFLVKTAGRVAPPVGGSDNVIPSVNSTFTLNVYASWDSGGNYFPVGSILRVKTMADDGPGLDIHDLYMEVTAASSISGRQLDPSAGETSPGYFALTCNLRYTPTSGPSGMRIPDGSAVILWTIVGASGYTGALKFTADESYAPFIDVFTVDKIASGSWSGTPPDVIPRVRLGNLDGVLGLSEEWGIALGTDLSDTSADAPYVVASDLGVRLNNVEFSYYSGSTLETELGDSLTFYQNASGSAGSILFKSVSGTYSIGQIEGYYDSGNSVLGVDVDNIDTQSGLDNRIRLTVVSDEQALIELLFQGDQDGTPVTGAVRFYADSSNTLAQVELDGVNLDGSNATAEFGGTVDLSGPVSVIDTYLRMKDADVAHGITGVATTNTYGELNVNGDNGGLDISGLTESIVGVNVWGYGTSTSTTEATTSNAPVQISGRLKSGTTYTTYAADDNILAIRNSGNTQFIVKGNGDFYYNGTGSAYDDYDDVALLDTANRTLDGRFEGWMADNRAILERERIVTYNDDGSHFVNGARMTRLLIGAIGQLHERLAELEGRS